MKVEYTDYLRYRLGVRRIPEHVPRRIFEESRERYFDNVTGRHVAILTVTYRRRRRRLMIAYDELPDRVVIVTVHPIEKQQIEHRVRSGRWIYEETETLL